MKRAKYLFNSYNAGYVQHLFDQFLQNPGHINEPWRSVFESGQAVESGLLGATAVRADGAASETQLRAAMAAAALFDAHRLNGHWAAHLDPLGSPPLGHPMLEPAFYDTSLEELATMPSSLLNLEYGGETLADVLQWIRKTYSGPIGYEFEHLEDPRRREWMRARIESWEYRQPLPQDDQRRLLRRLSEVEAFEQFLHRSYIGHKRFSVEGTDMLVPMLDAAIEAAASDGADQIVLGMAHRGRLNVLTHVLGRSYEAIISEFEGRHAGYGTTGDVKYHLGASGAYATVSGKPLTVELVPNPSHLEFVNPVVEGMARARQTRVHGRSTVRDPGSTLPILIHGDAAFAGQGVVSETLNFALLEGYSTGGTLHIIVNNQVGFTTDPAAARSTHYPSSIARGFRIPIFHVNADEPEECLAAIRMALAYRNEFRADVLIDLVGYRRFGHNESDEPAFTQPLLYKRIQKHPTVRRIWGDRLIERGISREEDVQAEWDNAYARLVDAQTAVRRSPATLPATEPSVGFGNNGREIATSVSHERLEALDRALHNWPKGFTVHPKLKNQFQRRSKVIADGGNVDWAHAEALAIASLLEDGTFVRMTGQDVERGTFSQRHLVLHDHDTGERFCPLASMDLARAPFELYNSPLAETGPLGFEYGYSVARPDALVLWEAQFGDFANAAQVIIDQFIAAGRAKWGQRSRLAMLLPHGYEGQGPEHSSARIERFLQLAGEDNLFVVNCTTPAQYFHVLRRQARLKGARPLVAITPKSLLRHPRAVSPVSALIDSEFRAVLDDDTAAERLDEVTRLIFCTGKVYYDLAEAADEQGARQVAIARIEELFPFPAEQVAEIVSRYPSLKEVLWVQEEPKNMGAWCYIEPKLRAAMGDGVPLRYVGRPERASPAEGYANVHGRQQRELIEAALSGRSSAPRPHKAKTG